jgi:DNA-binding NarL/FixJ family response regulator
MVWAGGASTVSEAVRLCEPSDRPDVLLIDSVSDPEWKLCLMLTGIHLELTVVALLDEDVCNPVDSAWALLHGARGLVGVDAETDRLGMAIRGAVELGHYVDAALEVSVVPATRREAVVRRSLSHREIEVLELVAEGKTAEQIGGQLGIAAHTVRTHVGHILRKLNARDRAHAVAVAFSTSLLPLRRGGPDSIVVEEALGPDLRVGPRP